MKIGCVRVCVLSFHQSNFCVLSTREKKKKL